MMYTGKFKSYKVEVVKAYRQKQANEVHQDWLFRPARARIRQRCLELVENGVEKRDEAMLRNFLEMDLADADYVSALKKTDADDFKLFENFLNKAEEVNPKEKNVELLAWLIGFEARPFLEYKRREQSLALISDEEDHLEAEKTVEEDLKPEMIGEEKQLRQQPNNINWMRYCVAATLLIGLSIWLAFYNNDCMYWNSDHYVASPCRLPRLDTPLVKLDRARLRQFHRIKRVDTLTTNSVGKLWYVRIKDSIEVFTGGGVHPLYPDRHLKKLTDYVVNYCHNHK